jgi:phosphohistidine swiveling domain-containing protein
VLGRLKGLRRKLFIKALDYAQKVAPLREDCIAEIGLGYPLLRRMLLELGRRFVGAGLIEQADDIFWMERHEVAQAALQLDHHLPVAGLVQLVRERRQLHAARLRLTPPPQVPQKAKIWGINMEKFLPTDASLQTGDTLKGLGASPGQASGVGRVLRGPQDFDQMRPGDVLVAAITTPAWTPLFAAASAIVTDTGGPLSHGSIVAREYGIPAVLGTGVATRRIHSGQTLTVDGSAGLVTIHAAGEETGGIGKVDLPASLQWTPPNPKGQYVRLSAVDLAPDPVSPLFESLGLSAIRDGFSRTGRILTRSEPVLPMDYFATINGYLYQQTHYNAREWWWVVVHMTAMPHMMRTGISYWKNEALPAYRAVAAQWESLQPANLTLSELWAGVQEVAVASGTHLATLMFSTLGAAAGSEGLFTRLYEKMGRKDGDPEGVTFLMGYDTQPIQAEKSLYDLAGFARGRPELAAYLLETLWLALLNDPQSPLYPDFGPHGGPPAAFGHMVYSLISPAAAG